jgi:hypothetical protein
MLNPKCPECGAGTYEVRSLPEHRNTWKRIFRCKVSKCYHEFEGELISEKDCQWKTCFLGCIVAELIEIGTVQTNCLSAQESAFGSWHCPQGLVEQSEEAGP